MALRRYRRAGYRRRRLAVRKPVRRYRRAMYRRRRFRRRLPLRRLALRRAGNLVRFTAKNNVNVFLVWPADSSATIPDSYLPVTSTSVGIGVQGILGGNRQFKRNLLDYRFIKFNYIAVKVTDVCHMGFTVPSQLGPTGSYISLGTTAIDGKIPVNVNWDVDQDFTFTKG